MTLAQVSTSAVLLPFFFTHLQFAAPSLSLPTSSTSVVFPIFSTTTDHPINLSPSHIHDQTLYSAHIAVLQYRISTLLIQARSSSAPNYCPLRSSVLSLTRSRITNHRRSNGNTPCPRPRVPHEPLPRSRHSDQPPQGLRSTPPRLSVRRATGIQAQSNIAYTNRDHRPTTAVRSCGLGTMACLPVHTLYFDRDLPVWFLAETAETFERRSKMYGEHEEGCLRDRRQIPGRSYGDRVQRLQSH